MPFATALRETLDVRRSQVPDELTSGQDLEEVLSRHLLAVEASADGEIITSVLLLSDDGKRLSHGAGPGLPKSFREAVDGTEIGPSAGSCGTAAFLGRSVYVRDIANDPLWADYRDLALPHGLRSCWSTPIRAFDGEIIGTFAVYRRTVGNPTTDEIEAIDMIAEHVADAILLAREIKDPSATASHSPRLRLVSDSGANVEGFADRNSHLLSLLERLQEKCAELERVVGRSEGQQEAGPLRSTAELTRKLIEILGRQIEEWRRL